MSQPHYRNKLAGSNQKNFDVFVRALACTMVFRRQYRNRDRESNSESTGEDFTTVFSRIPTVTQMPTDALLLQAEHGESVRCHSEIVVIFLH